MFKKQTKQVKKWLAGDKSSRRSKAHKRKVRILSVLAGFIFLLIFGGATTAFATIAFFSKDLPSPNTLSERQVPQTTKIYARGGELLYEIFGDERRTLVTLNDVPENLKQATIAVEDADFYRHSGFDILGILRAATVIAKGEGLQGGSTITQQVVKNTLLSPERTVTRKIKEFILAVQLERKYNKDEILQMYLNEAPYGGQAWGVAAASEMYFGKHVRDLNLAQASMLAGLPQAPTTYSPCGAHPENAAGRQKTVLNLMVKNGFITQKQADEVADKELGINCDNTNIKAPHFVMYVKDLLTEKFGEKTVEQGGLKVTTTLDWDKQKIAEEEVKKQLERLAAAKANASNAGVVSVNPGNGEILAMVGSANYFDQEHDGNVNVILAQRQPGSSIKPITYATAFKMGYAPATYLSDIKTCFPNGTGQPDYCPINWDDKFWGPMDIRTALSNSRNIPAVKILQVVGLQNMIDMAHELGITTLNEPERYGLALTLGGGEVKPIDMAQAFSVFAAMGQKYDLTPILKVEGPDGDVLMEKKENSGREVLEPGYAYLINNVLSDSKARARTFGGSMEIGRTLATKTGTTNDNRDAWTIGYTPDLATVVWVGNFDNSEMRGIMGSTGATPIMREYMRRALVNQPDKTWQRPKNIINVKVNALSGKIPRKDSALPTKSELFVKGSEPTQVDDFHVTVEVCEDQPNKLATEYHKEFGLSKEKTYTVLRELGEAWQKFTDEYMAGSDKYGYPPKEKCEIRRTEDGEQIDGPVVKISNPKDGEKLKVYGFDVTAKAYSSERITKLEFYWDDVIVKTINAQPYTVKYSLSMNESGEHTVTVKAFDSKGNESKDKITVSLPPHEDSGQAGDEDKVTPSVSEGPSPTPSDNSGGPQETPTPTSIISSFPTSAPSR